MKVKDILKDGSIWMPREDHEVAKPIVSVLLPSFQRAKSGLFGAAVRSVLNQTLRNIELIIIDDASEDGSFDLILDYMNADKRVSCIRHTHNIGLPAISEYEGFMRAKGEYIAFIFDDNEWQAEYLDKTVVFMEREKLKASYGIVRLYHGEGSQDYIELGNPNYDVVSLCDLNVTNFIANGGVVLHRDVLEKVGLYDPHLTLKRVCDWDLWRRIMMEFRFEGTGIYASDEHGFKLKDSLGNSVHQNGWCNAEQMRKDRNAKLRPQSFMDFDILGADERSTTLFLDNLIYAAEQNVKKSWFDPDDTSFQFLRKAERGKGKIKRVVVYAHLLDATLTLSFERLARGNPDLIFRFITHHSIGIHELLYADAFICIRVLSGAKPYLKVCRELKIPLYFYLDDNFIELAEDFKKDAIIKNLASSITHNNLKDFEGVFLSSKPLQDYFCEKELHKNIILLEPVIDENNIRKPNQDQGHEAVEIAIAFMGGGFRAQLFLTTVLPALEKLAEKRKLVLYFPQSTSYPQELKSKTNLTVERVPHTLSLDLALLRFAEKKLDILVHCGSDIKNNLYKTENSLINAVQLGAVLISSKEYPYKGQENGKPRFLLADNTEQSWYAILNQLIESPALREEIYTNALDYCLHRYNVQNARSVIGNQFKQIENISTAEIIRRYEDMFEDLYYHRERFTNIHVDSQGLPPRSLTEVPLSLSKLIEKKTSYNIRCKVSNFSELGLCLTFDGLSEGYLKIIILEGNNCLREAKLDLQEIERDNWTYVRFEPIADSQNKVYTIALQFDYEPGSSRVGVFEDATKRTFGYKVMNKLGLHVKGMDALFADCRE